MKDDAGMSVGLVRYSSQHDSRAHCCPPKLQVSGQRGLEREQGGAWRSNRKMQDEKGGENAIRVRLNAFAACGVGTR